MTERILSHYWGDDLVYCENHKEPIEDKHNLIKNHDFDLSFDPNVDGYLVMWRNPAHSLASLYEWKLSDGQIENASQDTWLSFWFSEMQNWTAWMWRWVHNAERFSRPRLVISYEQVVQNPHRSIRSIIQFQSDNPVDEERLHRAVAQENPSPRRS